MSEVERSSIQISLNPIHMIPWLLSFNDDDHHLDEEEQQKVGINAW